MNIKILVVTHKRYKMPDDPMYIPIQSGHEIWDDLGYMGDDTGDNISYKNPIYNELCPIYWAWKNLQSDFIGIVHYRRYLSLKVKSKNKYECILSKEDAIKLCSENDIILPPKRRYYFESIYKHYASCQSNLSDMHTKDLETLKSVMYQNQPDYVEAFETVMNSHSGHMFHIFIMKKEIYDSFCEWMFTIMFEVEKIRHEKRQDKTRYIGALSEFLLDIWIIKKKYMFKEIGLVEIEEQSIVKRGVQVLNRKFLNAKVRL